MTIAAVFIILLLLGVPVAFTLGLTTAIDIVIFILFTHPVMQLLARTRFFGSKIFSSR